jgi:hypothetical protein
MPESTFYQNELDSSAIEAVLGLELPTRDLKQQALPELYQDNI